VTGCVRRGQRRQRPSTCRSSRRESLRSGLSPARSPDGCAGRQRQLADRACSCRSSAACVVSETLSTQVDRGNLLAAVAHLVADGLPRFAVDRLLLPDELPGRRTAARRTLPAGQFLVAGLGVQMPMHVEGVDADRRDIRSPMRKKTMAASPCFDGVAGNGCAPPQPNIQGLAAMQALFVWRLGSAGTSTLPSMSVTECKKAHRTTVGGVGPLLFSHGRFQLPVRTLPGWRRPLARGRVDRNPSYGILARLHERGARRIP